MSTSPLHEQRIKRPVRISNAYVWSAVHVNLFPSP